MTENSGSQVNSLDSSTGRPNILLVLTDQQRWDTVGAYGSPMNLTPNLDLIAENGVQFEYGISAQPVCTPSRACIQTGQYATTHGAWRNGIQLEPQENLVAQELHQSGYETAYAGMWDLANSEPNPVPEELRGGYEDYWRVADSMGNTHPYEGVLFDEDGEPVPYDGYRVDAVTDMAIEYLRRDHDGPFLLCTSYFEPHHQDDCERFIAPEGYAHRYENPWVPPDLSEQPDGDWFQELPDYYGMCRRIDECFGRLLDALREQGIFDETIIVFTSDHGCHFRTRNWEYKRSCHDASVRVPWVLGGADIERSHITEPVSHVDLAPTLLDVAGVDIPDEMQGSSTLPLITGETADWKDEAFIQISASEIGRALRTERWTYSVAANVEHPRQQPEADTYTERYLYDNYADPGQQNNLIGKPQYQSIAEELRGRLEERMIDTGESVDEIFPATQER